MTDEDGNDYVMTNPRDVWDIQHINMHDETTRVGYPTQKPVELIDKIIRACTEPGDIVMDCFLGSGTTFESALKNGRKFIGSDINLGSIEISKNRILKFIGDTESQNKLEFADEEKLQMFKGTSFYNVNNYEVFKNPIEAKQILIEAMEVEPYSTSNLWDGLKDGRKVKILPANLNRIATRADLSEILSNIDEKDYKQKFDKNPNKVVDEITLVCMGHEPDLAAHLEEQLKPFKIDIEVVDILRDKSNLHFKRDAEADIRIVKDKLVVKNFYPMNLMQKLSIDKTKVSDWKELTESIMIDFNYDGSVFTPQLLDIAEDKGLVKGEYKIPADAGTICVKITDLLSESLIKELSNG